MSEDLTRNMPDSFEERVLAQLVSITQELAATRREFTEQIAAVRQEQERQRVMIEHVHARGVSTEARLAALEEKVDERLRETRPIWESVLARLTGVETEMSGLNRHFRSLTADFFSLRVRVEKLEGQGSA
jgi:predicted  nucleic acid-binding Zn-ribbon protein